MTSTDTQAQKSMDYMNSAKCYGWVPQVTMGSNPTGQPAIVNLGNGCNLAVLALTCVNTMTGQPGVMWQPAGRLPIALAPNLATTTGPKIIRSKSAKSPEGGFSENDNSADGSVAPSRRPEGAAGSKRSHSGKGRCSQEEKEAVALSVLSSASSLCNSGWVQGRPQSNGSVGNAKGKKHSRTHSHNNIPNRDNSPGTASCGSRSSDCGSPTASKKKRGPRGPRVSASAAEAAAALDPANAVAKSSVYKRYNTSLKGLLRASRYRTKRRLEKIVSRQGRLGARADLVPQAELVQVQQWIAALHDPNTSVEKCAEVVDKANAMIARNKLSGPTAANNPNSCLGRLTAALAAEREAQEGLDALETALQVETPTPASVAKVEEEEEEDEEQTDDEKCGTVSEGEGEEGQAMEISATN